MSHRISSIAFFKDKPWHGLGAELSKDDLYDINKTMEKAGLNWLVETVPVYDENGDVIKLAKLVRRTDTKKHLGVVGPRWQPLQNHEKFKWFEPFLETKQAQLNTAGALDEDRRVWVLAKLNIPKADVMKNDPVESYALLSDSFDGSLAVRVGFTPQRVVCANTLAMAHGDKSSKLIRIRHTAQMKATLEEVRETMDLARQEFTASVEQYELLARRPISQRDLRKYIKKVLKADEKDEISTRTENIMEEIFRNYDREQRFVSELIAEHEHYHEHTRKEQEQVLEAVLANTEGKTAPQGGTLWNAYNAVTEWLTHQRGRSTETRLNSLWFGDGATTNKRALDLALDVANGASL